MGGDKVKTDKQWQAEMDARTLADAISISGDAPRRQAARSGAKRIIKDEEKNAKEQQKRTDSLKAVAKNSYSKEFKKEHGRKKK